MEAELLHSDILNKWVVESGGSPFAKKTWNAGTIKLQGGRIVLFTESKVKKQIVFSLSRKNPFAMSYFSSPEKERSVNHVYHAIHHKFTTKTPRAAHRFSQKPLQKRHSTTPQRTVRKSIPPRGRRYTRHEVAARTGAPATGLRLWGGLAQAARPAGHALSVSPPSPSHPCAAPASWPAEHNTYAPPDTHAPAPASDRP